MPKNSTFERKNISVVVALAAAFLLPAPSELRSSRSGCELCRFQRWKLARGIRSRSFPASPPLHFLSGLLWVRPRGAPQDLEALTTNFLWYISAPLLQKYVKGEYKNRFNCSVMPVHFTEYNYIPPWLSVSFSFILDSVGGSHFLRESAEIF